jgi:hypothetical protein
LQTVLVKIIYNVQNEFKNSTTVQKKRAQVQPGGVSNTELSSSYPNKTAQYSPAISDGRAKIRSALLIWKTLAFVFLQN